MDNKEFAVLSKLSELAERHGIKAYEYDADVKYDTESDKTQLKFIAVEPHAEKKVDRMIDSIAGPDGMKDGTLSGDVKSIIDALDAALHVAPKLKTMGR